MLRALLKREIEIEPLDEAVAHRAGPTTRPHLSPIRAPNLCPNSCPKARAKPRAKSFPIALLYPESEPEPQLQAEALLHEIQMHAEDAIGKYVPSSHLERFYGELCDERGWERQHWCAIGRELGKLTDKVCKKRGNKRFMAYKIPRCRA